MLVSVFLGLILGDTFDVDELEEEDAVGYAPETDVFGRENMQLEEDGTESKTQTRKSLFQFGKIFS